MGTYLYILFTWWSR